ncbi:hypothetical protein SADUNF_Sadunf05G0161200 [Salix dunnii]|uniref:Uncharacterized protein n=1 Tax=Salix dunnii TaxID=1413687 RepID=A0A835K909_9ROSI|nr:hypothetical protein SADUNF_Sadunf05G0161200 [Salix dunnii]
MKIQPIDYQTLNEPVTHQLESVKPVGKSRLKRLFERQFLRNSAAEKVGAIEESHLKDGSNEFEPSSVCLAKMVQNFIEDSNEKQPSVRCNRNRCNCFNGNCNDSSEDEFDSFGGFGDSNLSSSVEAIEILKSLVQCESVCERNLLADAARVVDKNKMCKRKDDVWRKIVADGLLGLGYDASICKSRWEKSPSYPAGERLLIDVDFRSEFEIARSTKTFKSLLQTLPYIFVGKADRLQKIIAIVSDAAKQSLKKKGMPIPPWRKAEYIKAKWLSPHPRTKPPLSSKETDPEPETEKTLVQDGIAEVELSCQEKNSAEDDAEMGESMFALSSEGSVAEEEVIAVKEWNPPEVKPKSLQIGIKMVTGLASVIEDEP